MRIVVVGVLLSLSVWSSVVVAHSWIECTKYADGFGPITGSNYDSNLCQGTMRGFNKLYNQNGNIAFGTEDGKCAHCRRQTPGGQAYDPPFFDKNINSVTCLFDKGGDNYNSKFPMTTYTQGEQVRIIWPGKNHGGPANPPGACTDNHADPLDQIHVVCGQQNDLTISQMLNTKDFLAVDLKKTDQTNKYGKTTSTGKGFKNCPGQCQNTDKTVCFSDWVVPPQIPAGNCTFYWIWGLNPGEFYTSCWEATVKASNGGGGGAQPVPAPAPTNNPQPQPQPGNCPNKIWNQCDGQLFTGSKCCPDGNKCRRQDQWYSQCVPN